MRRILPVAVVLAVLALAACHPSDKAATEPADAAHASPELTAAADAAHKAADSFLVLAGDSTYSGKVPHADDPAAKSLVDAVFDMRPLPTRPVPMNQLAAVNDWLVSVAKVGRAYVLAGTGAARDDDPGGAVVEAQVDRNFAAYAPELGRYLDAQNALMSLEAASIARERVAEPAMSSTPDGEKELAAMHGPLLKSIDAVLVILAHPGPSPEWRRARMPYLLALATQAMKLNTPADAAAVRAHALTLAASSEDATLQVDLAEMAKTMGGATQR
jgi:hypothetical protein